MATSGYSICNHENYSHSSTSPFLVHMQTICDFLANAERIAVSTAAAAAAAAVEIAFDSNHNHNHSQQNIDCDEDSRHCPHDSIANDEEQTTEIVCK